MTSKAESTPWNSAFVLILILSLAALPLPAREKDALQYGTGLIVTLPFPEDEVAQVVHDVVQNGIIRGTREYNKDQYLNGATAADSTHVFPERNPGGRVFYKVRLKAIDPRNFKDGGDVGTLAVRYILQPQGERNTVLRIDARFVEDFRKTSHPSNGSVESAEYKDIHDRLDAIESMRSQTAELEKEKAEKEKVEKEKQDSLAPDSAPSTPSNSGDAADPSNAPAAQTLAVQTLKEHVRDLKRQVERLVKSPGAPLKSAPFHTASTLLTLPAGTEVLIVISTPYWLGVETHEGQHGWILRDQLEQSQ